MGITSVTAARIYKAEAAGKPGKYSQMSFFMKSLENTGWSKTSSFDVHTTDSAAGAMALLTRLKTSHLQGAKQDHSGNCTEEGKILEENVAELAIEKTPGATYAKNIRRDFQDNGAEFFNPNCLGHDIALQLV